MYQPTVHASPSMMDFHAGVFHDIPMDLDMSPPRFDEEETDVARLPNSEKYFNVNKGSIH